HFFLFWGFVFLAMAAGIDAAHHWIHWPNLEGTNYIVMSWIVDVTGFLAMIGIILLAYIRYVQKPERLNDTKASDGWIILLVFTILFTGFVIEGARIAAQIQQTPFLEQVPYEKVASPFGWMFAAIMGGMSVDTLLMWHRYLWWFHMTIAFLFLALVPFTKLWHIGAGMFNYAFRDLEPSANRMVYNIEEAETFGAEHIEDFGWKDLLDLDACIRCGRCQENCPAYNTGKHLNPKITIIQHMKQHLDAKAPYLIAQKGEDTPHE
ncbi:MAG: respiratory nitrate reductase subunit gamma, partial [Syntrophomonas sp.]|nr:respiratory nitrate reductase subunit gamma [Syntrophomonas sp.]